ncbi:MAG: DnaJ domain-containing protein [Proteobacteria bacterium]|nr:DnaJ domain-containing protein [Pseudomonadota bacterium]
MLSRIDGQTPWRVLREMGGLTPSQVDDCLESFAARGIVVFEETKPEPPPRTAALERSEVAPPETLVNEADAGFVDGSLDLPVAVQKRILEFETLLDGSYYDVLGVERDADAKTIKRAYFTLSKEFHPDRYFRRDIGSYLGRLERIFKKILEAYELLSDGTARAEIDRSLVQGPPPSSRPAAATGADAPLSPIERLRQRMPFRIPEEVLNERRQKAQSFYEAAMISSKTRNHLEAASSIRLAIAFDPWNADYKQAFGEIQAAAADAKARQLLSDANSSADGSEYKQALRMFEDALLYKPHDPEINAKAAEMALEVDQESKALEYAERAVERSPDVGRYRVVLAKVHKAKGELGHALKELERALELDPGDHDALGLMKRWKPSRRTIS